jgi:protein phosphatase
MRHVLTNAIGARDETDVEVGEWTWREGETLLLCSDGVHGALHDQTLARLSAGDGPIDASAQRLLDAALAVGGKDNITAVVLRRGE